LVGELEEKRLLLRSRLKFEDILKGSYKNKWNNVSRFIYLRIRNGGGLL
jgi:hypothetical protein